MRPVDYGVVAVFFLAMVGIGLVSVRKVKGSKDYFVGGGKVPWWLAGVSLHVSSYSGVVFVAMAGVAYQYGFTVYVWWALPFLFATLASVTVFSWRWARLRAALSLESPTEYLATRYGVGAQQLIAWCGVLLKLFDVGAKWAALGVLLHGFTGLPVASGILLSGGISLLYVTVGGLWADLYTDFAQFLVQLGAGLVLFVTVMVRLGGPASLAEIWGRLPAGHGQPFNGPYTPGFLVGYALASLLSANGGTWNQAIRFMAAPSGRSAAKSALLCGSLYLIWPFVLFFPMWAGPLLVPGLSDPTQIYPLLVRGFLPPGFVGCSLAAMFAATMSMTTSDTNAISSVLTRDILPRFAPRFREMDSRHWLRLARWTTLAFTAGTLIIALEAERFGGVLGLIVSWFAALVGPTSIPMLFGLLPAFASAGARSAIGSILAGLAVFAVAVVAQFDVAARVSLPVIASAVTFCLLAWSEKATPVAEPVRRLMSALS